jgi:hypothetical protein
MLFVKFAVLVVLQAVILFRKNYCGFEGFGFFELHGGVGDNDNGIAYVDEAGSGAVHADHAGTAGALDNIGLETLAVVDIEDGDFLVLDKVGCIHQVFIYSDTAYIMQVGLGDLYPMYFGF